MLRPAVAVVMLCVFGCTDLEQFDGDFTGPVVGTEDTSFVRRGFPAGTQMSLSFDPAQARTAPGTLSTSDGTFEQTALRFIAPLEHDQLSLFDFPGARVRNFIFAARTVDSTEREARDTLVFVSLMQDDTVEVRVIAGSGDEEAGDLFGLFRLEHGP